MVFTIVSKDKLTLSMFVDFYRTLYDSGLEILDLNSLTSNELLNSITRNFIGTHLERSASESASVLIKFKVKGDIPLEKLPIEIRDKSTFIVKFDLYSTEPVVLKNRFPERLGPILERWKKNIEKMNSEL